MRHLVLATVILIVIVGIAAGVLVVYAKTSGFTAKGSPSRVERFIANSLLEISYPQSAKTMRNPLPATAENLQRGRTHYTHDCAICHGDDGAGKTEIAAGLYPKVPNLRHESDMSDGELFYVIKNGVRFTGMPGWSDPDDEIWKLVLFIRDLPNQPPVSPQAEVRTSPERQTAGSR